MRTIAFSEYSPPRTFLWFLLVLSLPDVGGGQERGYTGEVYEANPIRFGIRSSESGTDGDLRSSNADKGCGGRSLKDENETTGCQFGIARAAEDKVEISSLPETIGESSTPTRTGLKEQDHDSISRCRFKGFENERFQQHDSLITEYVHEFNSNKQKFADCRTAQAKSIPDLDPCIVKSLMIQESGGRNGDKYRAAWKTDPARVNVLGAWNQWKQLVGLTKPTTQEAAEEDTTTPEALLKNNLIATIKYLVRKGFARTAQPAKNHIPTSVSSQFQGWQVALERYNGVPTMTENGKRYRENYAERIVKRATDKNLQHRIGLPKTIQRKKEKV